VKLMNATVCSNISSKTNFKFWDDSHSNDFWQYPPKSKVARSLAFAETAWKKKEKDVVTIISPFEGKYEKAKSRIIKLCSNQIETTAPNQNAQRLALQALKLFKKSGVLPSLINSSHDESLVFEFFVGKDVYSIEFCNSGEISYLRRIQGQMLRIAEVSEEDLEGVVLEISHVYANL
jgi:hypothetical protein